MAHRRLIIALVAVAISVPALLRAADEDTSFKKQRDLIHTYLGPVVDGGYNRIAYRDWFVTHTGIKSIQGFYAGGGALLGIYARYLGGELVLGFHYNKNDAPLWHMAYSLMGKAVIPIGETFNFTMGLGLYFETPPANRSYQGGAGFKGSLGTIINTSFDTKLIIDGYARYGWYELGEGSTKISAGISLGFIFKVGRL